MTEAERGRGRSTGWGESGMGGSGWGAGEAICCRYCCCCCGGGLSVVDLWGV